MEITKLPEECISHIISFTSPRDACRSSLVCPLFRSAIDSDVVWRKFLPHDYHQILSNSHSALASYIDSFSKKQLFFYLSDHSIIFYSYNNMSFKIDKESGKKCYVVGARRLSIAWGDTSAYWRWISLAAESRVAELRLVWWLDIKGRMETNILSPETTYGAYFVYKLNKRSVVFEDNPVEFRIYFEGEEKVHGHGGRRSVFLDPSEDEQQLCQDRGDGWLEVEMGEFFNDGGEDHQVVVCSLMETDDYISKSGLVVEGIEFRPKSGR